MSQYELIAFDMDGTLLNSRKEITPLTLAALNRAADAGKKIALSTGRCRPELDSYLSLMKRSLEPSLVKELLKLAIKEGAMMHLLDRESIVQTDQFQHMEQYGMGVYKPMYERVVTAWDNLYETYCASPFPVEKVNFYHTDLESRERTRRRIEEAGFPVILADAERGSLEISAAGVDKGSGLRKLCERLNIPVSRTIAAGDADNDISILKAAGLSVAMGNALPHIKELADVTVSDCDHDGCAEIIDSWLLGE